MAKSDGVKATGKRKGVVQRPAKRLQKYAPEPTKEEYKTFPEGYRLEDGNYPAEEILKVKNIGGPEKKRQYLVQWKPHPITLQYFAPSWIDHEAVTPALLASWEEKQHLQKTREIFIDLTGDNHNEISDRTLVESVRATNKPPPNKRRFSDTASSEKQNEDIQEEVERPVKSQKARRIVSDGSSDAEEDEETRTQVSSNEKGQTTDSSGTSSLRSPPPEVEDSQASVFPPQRLISVVIPPRPSNFRAEEYLPISSSIDSTSSSGTPTSIGLQLSGEATISDYPTPESEQVQSPALSDISSALFFPDTTQPSLNGSPAVLQTQVQSSTPSLAAPRELLERPADQLVDTTPESSVQVVASGQSSLPSHLTPLSAQNNIGIPTSSVNETQSTLGGDLPSLDNSIDLQTPPPKQPDQLQSQISQSQVESPVSGRAPPSRVIRSSLKSQTSPQQGQKQRLFRTLHSDGIESWPSQGYSQTRLQSQPEGPGREASVHSVSNPSSSAPSPGTTTGSLSAMAAPSHRSSARTGPTSTTSKSSRGTTLSLQEQLVQARALRQRNAASVSPLEASPEMPKIPQAREPTPVKLTTRTSNPTLPKVEMPEPDSSSAMQVDHSTLSKAPNAALQIDDKEVPPAPTLHIQQSIEMDEPNRLDSTTQDSSLPEPNEARENGNAVHASSQALMPNFPILLPGEFAIPLHADGRAQDAYRDAILSKQKALSKYLRRGSSSSTPSSNGLAIPKTEASDMTDLVERLDLITSLMDLGFDGMLTQSSFSGTELARWVVKASSKFAFIKTLIDALQLFESSLVIFARAGQTQQVFEKFFSSFEVDCRTYTGSGEASPSSAPEGKCTVHLVAGGQKPNISLKPGPSLIIAFDNSYDSRSEYVLNLRGEKSKQIPVIHLLVTNSSEHIERCLPVNMPSPQRNRLLMESILRGASHMGRILTEMNRVTLDYYSHLSGGTSPREDDLARREKMLQKMPDLHLKRLAQQVGKATIDNEFSSAWSTSPPMPPLELDEIPGLITQQLRLPSPSPMPASPIGTPSLRKRLLDGDGSETPGASKRQRMTPVPGVSPHNEASYIQHLQHALKAAKDEAASEKLARMSAEDSGDKTRGQLNEWRQSVSDLQKRVEYHRDQDHKARTKVKQMTKDAERFSQLRERDTAGRDALKLQISQLKEELASARQDLKTAGGDTAALEVAREEARTASAILAKTQKELASTKQQGEYFRVQYQAAMTTGRLHQNEAEALQAQVSDLKIDASDEKRRLKLVNFDDAAKVHMDRIEKLELEKKALESMIRRLNVENMSLKANRGVSTRASSVQPPGSPRAKSRGGSPVPGLIAAGPAGSRASALRHER